MISSKELYIFSHKTFSPIRALSIDGFTWIALEDVLKNLQIKNWNDVSENVPDYEIRNCEIPDVNATTSQLKFISIGGLHCLNKSLPVSDFKFMKWISEINETIKIQVPNPEDYQNVA